jgi:predicted nucleic acid-binding protein
MSTVSVEASASLSINVFIDANVIAKWIAVSILASEQKTPREKEEFLEQQKASKDKYRKVMYACYDFVEQMLNGNGKSYTFMCSPLILTEVLSVLFERHVYGYMQRNYVPIDEFHTTRKDGLGDGVFNEIYSQTEKYFDKIKGKLDIAIEDRDNLFKVAGVLISEYGLLSQDAHVMSQAIFNKCKYFVTTDKELLSKFTIDNQKQKESEAYPVALFPATFDFSLKDISKVNEKGDKT